MITMRITQFLKMRSCLFFLAMTCCSLSWSSPPPLPNFQATYVIKYDGIKVGTSTLNLQSSANGHYQLELHNKPSIPFIKGDVIESSIGLWTGTAPTPTQYHYFYHYFTKQKHIDLQFNWRKDNLVLLINGKPWHMPIEPTTQDKLSYQLALRQDLQAGKTKLNYQIADGGLIKNYQFHIEGNETITTPLGTFDTVMLVRTPIPGKENVTLWLAKNLHYQVIRVEEQKNIVDFGTADIMTYQSQEAAHS